MSLEQLSSFDAADRRAALASLAAGLATSPAVVGDVNMHMHSFFSYNANDWSPARLAWEARKRGLYAAGLCDFDVLDGAEEFLAAGRLLGLRTTVNIETRVFLNEYADVDINSPGEPGVFYVMGAGFAAPPVPGSGPAGQLAAYRAGVRDRNMALVERINKCLPAIVLDYERDVLPLTPAGAATERHLVRAYVRRAESVHPGLADRRRFWGEVLDRDETAIRKLLDDPVAMEDAVRSRLVKRGGMGYQTPTAGSFPPVDEFLAWVSSCRAVPMATWLDGASEGEADPVALLECLAAKGVAAANIIPDRNWNFADPDMRRSRLTKLAGFVAACDRLHLPINIGTEFNKPGLPFVDLLDGEELSTYRERFIEGALTMVGHTTLLAWADYPLTGEAADEDFGGDTRARNAFFASVGALPPVSEDVARRLSDPGQGPALDIIRRSAVAGHWKL